MPLAMIDGFLPTPPLLVGINVDIATLLDETVTMTMGLTLAVQFLTIPGTMVLVRDGLNPHRHLPFSRAWVGQTPANFSTCHLSSLRSTPNRPERRTLKTMHLPLRSQLMTPLLGMFGGSQMIMTLL
ncbi:hypothetical protein SUGI_0120450 [Cryptomeria japonica]|nr:hypothetical protein SUGI_0120450 [Cryptomeria japonica]